jgi:Kef-type K+ transport system membrane component KefB
VDTPEGLWESSPTVLAAATVVSPDLRSLALVLLASSLGALLSRVSRHLVLPTVVVEIVLGILIGPAVLDIAKVDPYLQYLATFGLALLFFFIGLEVVEQKVPRASLARGTRGWVLSIALGLAVGVLLQQLGLGAEWWVLGIALTTTSLGTLVPILGDAGVMPTPLGVAVLGTGVAGEFWPIVVISVFLTGTRGAVEEIVLLVVFGLVVGLAATAALRARPPRVVRVLQETVHTTGQMAVRLSVFVVVALALLAHDVGFDFVLGALAAGLVVGLAIDSPEGEPVRMRLEGIGFGFLIPIYFVTTGMNFDLDSLLTTKGLSLAALFLALLFVVRGASAMLWLRELGPRRSVGLALFGATALPLIVAIVDVAMDHDAIDSDVGASLVGAGMISVLTFPLAGLRTIGRERDEALDADAGRRPTREY